MRKFAVVILAAALSIFAQSESAYEDDNSSSDSSSSTSLLDLSRLSVSHSMSFSMGGSQFSDLKSQSLYSTMMTYRFNAPLELSLNFALPIHSTFNTNQNFNQENIQSLDYFKNVPFDVSLSWKPTENLTLRFSAMRIPEDTYYGYSGFFPGSYSFHQTFGSFPLDRYRERPGSNEFFWSH